MTTSIADQLASVQKMLTPEKLSSLSASDRAQVLELMGALESSVRREQSQDSFLTFCASVWPAFMEGGHHRKMAKAFERVANGDCKRLMINMPPRMGKSQLTSWLLPAWIMGKMPDKKIIMASHTAELAVRFGRMVRNLIGSDEFKDIFPETSLTADSKAAGRFDVSGGGEYFSVGVGGAVTGRGADLLIIDDPHSEQQGQQADPKVFDSTYEWFSSGPRQRLQPGGAIIIVMTRWSQKDLCGQIMRDSMQRDGMDEWEVIELPAILPSGNSLWPDYWPVAELEKLKAELPISKWEAQYQQQPTSEESAIVKRDWWRVWEERHPPDVSFVIQSWDTAFMKHERADYSACTTWGVFYHENDEGMLAPNIILLDALKERLEFPTLKQRAYEMYREWEPDAFIVEAKAAGAPLIYELRAIGISVQEYTPSRGNDKVSRVNAIADFFASGIVWAPPKRWAEEVIEEFASFPVGDHDDLVDSSTQALLRFRQGGFIALDHDDIEESQPRRIANYY
jgi:predicted phage terminase large subunit-like protein